MNNFGITFIMGAALLSRASCLKCYTCFSYDSWKDCDKDLWLRTCDPGVHDACTKLTVNITVNFGKDFMNKKMVAYAKLCGRVQQCSEQSCINYWGTNLAKITECSIKCCRTTGCFTPKDKRPVGLHRSNHAKDTLYHFNHQDYYNNHALGKQDNSSIGRAYRLLEAAARSGTGTIKSWCIFLLINAFLFVFCCQ